MKKVLLITVTLCLLLALGACMTAAQAPADETPSNLSVASVSTYSDDRFSFSVDGYWGIVAEDENSITIVPEDYNSSNNSLIVTIAEKDADFASHTKESMDTAYTPLFSDFTPGSFSREEIAGHDVIVYTYSFSSGEVSPAQTQYIVDTADGCIIFTFTDRTEAFADAIALFEETLTVA